MKQTAVELLIQKREEQGTLYFSDFCEAKEMEKKQLKSEEIAKEHFRKQRDEGLLEQSKMYSDNEVELITNEMVNWAIDNPNPQSGKKFDEVLAKYKKKQ